MKEVEEYVDSEETIKILQDLIRINSTNPSLAERAPGELKIAEYIYEEMTDIGLTSTLMDVKKNRPNVIGVLNNHTGKTLMLHGHTDTVGVDHMQIDPFKPTIKDNKIFGRGACDMKGGLAAMLSAARAVINSGIELKGKLILTTVVDEEYKSIGTEDLIKNYTADAAIVCEPTNLQIATAHKGYVWIEIETWGKAAHGSKPEIGVDAIVKMGKILIEIEKLQHTYSRKVHKLVGSPSVHASLIKGGRELSTYPDRCKLYLERRTIPNENAREVKREIQEILMTLSDQDSQLTASSKIIFERGALEVSSNTEISRTLREAIFQITTKEPRIIGLSGWFDSKILDTSRIPVVLFGPGKIEHAHSANEYVSLDQVITAAKILSRTIADFCK